MPSATLGRTKRSAARRYSAGLSTAPVNWTRSAIPSDSAIAARSWRSFPGPTRMRLAERPSSDLRPGFEQERKVLLGMEPAGEDRARPREQFRLDRAWDPVGTDRRRRRWPSGRSATPRLRALATAARSRPRSLRMPYWPGSPGGAARPIAVRSQLVGLAVVARAGRLDQRWPAAEERDGPVPSPPLPRAPDGCGPRRSRNAADAVPTSRPPGSSARTRDRPPRS